MIAPGAAALEELHRAAGVARRVLEDVAEALGRQACPSSCR